MIQMTSERKKTILDDVAVGLAVFFLLFFLVEVGAIGSAEAPIADDSEDISRIVSGAYVMGWITPQQFIAYQFGVPTSVINPNVDFYHDRKDLNKVKE